jgi:hypothetical protein
MYNSDVLTYYHEHEGAGSFVLLPVGDRVIVGASIQLSGVASTSEILCGTTTIVRNYGKDFPYNTLSYPCNNTITVSKTGQDKASYIVSVIDRSKYQASQPTFKVSTTSAVMTEYGVDSAQMLFNWYYMSWVTSVVILFSLGILTFLTFMKRR